LEDGWRLLGIGGCGWVSCHFFPERGDSGSFFIIKRSVIAGDSGSFIFKRNVIAGDSGYFFIIMRNVVAGESGSFYIIWSRSYFYEGKEGIVVNNFFGSCVYIAMPLVDRLVMFE
jgi:hypothetical protein